MKGLEFAFKRGETRLWLQLWVCFHVFLQTFSPQKTVFTMRLLGRYLNDDGSGDIKLMPEVGICKCIEIAGSRRFMACL